MNFLKIKKEKILTYFFIILLVEALSFITWQQPVSRELVYFFVVAIIGWLTWRNLNYGLLIASGELLVGSFGYIFSVDIFGQTLSLRMFIWLIVIISSVKYFSLNRNSLTKFNLIEKKIFFVYLGLMVYLLFVFINGFLRNNLVDVIFDGNAWLYLLLFIPWLFFDKKYLSDLWHIWLSGIIWLWIKTVILLYIFSHNFLVLANELYLWTRDFRLGEITFVAGNFWRVFMQSQIMALFLLLVIIYLWWRTYQKKIEILSFYQFGLLAIFGSSVVLMSYSRSFWLGLISGLVVLLVYIFFQKNSLWQFLKYKLILFSIIFLSVFLVFFVIRFPWPAVTVTSNDLFIGRLQNFSSEPASNTRLQQLEPLLLAIKNNLFFGSGFGTVVSYQSRDPRILSMGQEYADNYSTYAFEWGYLDIFLKFGLVGTFVYLYFIYLLLSRAWLAKTDLSVAFLLAFVAILITNLTTPYLNHPLGLGILFWLVAVVNKSEKKIYETT